MAAKKAKVVPKRSASAKGPQPAQLGSKKVSKDRTAMLAINELKGAAGKRIDVGDRLPDATLSDQNDQPCSLKSLRGKPAIVYFYPKDDTPGCTREACAFQRELAKFARLEARVVGISPDPSGRHAKFAEKYGLTFSLLADPTREYARSCGVLVPKTLYGRTSIGIERTTFLLDSKGVVCRVWRKVKVDGHVDEVVAAVRSSAEE